MSADNVRKVIYDEFISMMSILHPTVRYRMENISFEQKDEIWVSFEIHEVDAMRASIGTVKRFQRHKKMISAIVYVPEGEGVKVGNELVEDIVSTFEEKVMVAPGANNISFKVARVDKPGLKNGVYPIVITIPFHWDTCKSS